MAILYVDIEGGNDANNGLTFANRKRTITSASTSASPGDTVRIMGNPDPLLLGNCSWTNLSPTLTLPAAATQLLYEDGTWVAATNVTATASTTRRSGLTSAQFVIATAFTTGKIGYFDLGSAQDLSMYDAITLAMQITVATPNISIYQIRLCSDAVGDVAVNTLTFPTANALANSWINHTLSNGSSLGNNIRSIALYTTVDPVTPTIRLDNINACQENNINLTNLVGKGDGLWWKLKEINGTTAIIDTSNQSLATVISRGYFGDTETVPTYILKPLVSSVIAASDITDLNTINTSGVDGNPITYSGGWDRTDMSTQVGISMITGINNIGEVIGVVTRNFLQFEKIGGTGCSRLISVSGTCTSVNIRDCIHVSGQANGILYNSATITRCIIENCTTVQCNGNGINISLGNKITLIGCKSYTNLTDGYVINANITVLENCEGCNNVSDGCFLNTTDGTLITNGVFNNNGVTGIYLLTASQNKFENCQCKNNLRGLDVSQSSNNTFYNLITENNTQASINSLTSSSTDNFFFNWIHNETITILTPINFENTKYISVNDNASPDNHIIFTDGGQISSTTPRISGMGIAWQLQPTLTIRDDLYPLRQRIRAVAVKANILHTAKIWMRRNSGNIVGIFGMERCQIDGISTTLTAEIINSDNDWEELSLSFTPTVDGVVDFFVDAYGGTTHTVQWDDFSIAAAERLDASSGDFAYAKFGVFLGGEINSPSGGEVSYSYWS